MVAITLPAPGVKGWNLENQAPLRKLKACDCYMVTVITPVPPAMTKLEFFFQGNVPVSSSCVSNAGNLPELLLTCSASTRKQESTMHTKGNCIEFAPMLWRVSVRGLLLRELEQLWLGSVIRSGSRRVQACSTPRCLTGAAHERLSSSPFKAHRQLLKRPSASSSPTPRGVQQQVGRTLVQWKRRDGCVVVSRLSGKACSIYYRHILLPRAAMSTL